MKGHFDFGGFPGRFIAAKDGLGEDYLVKQYLSTHGGNQSGRTSLVWRRLEGS